MRENERERMRERENERECVCVCVCVREREREREREPGRAWRPGRRQTASRAPDRGERASVSERVDGRETLPLSLTFSLTALPAGHECKRASERMRGRDRDSGSWGERNGRMARGRAGGRAE